MKQGRLDEFLTRGRAAQDAADEAQRRAELAETLPGERVVRALELAEVDHVDL